MEINDKKSKGISTGTGTIPKCRNFRAKEPRINVDLQEENGHLEGGIPEKTIY